MTAPTAMHAAPVATPGVAVRCEERRDGAGADQLDGGAERAREGERTRRRAEDVRVGVLPSDLFRNRREQASAAPGQARLASTRSSSASMALYFCKSRRTVASMIAATKEASSSERASEPQSESQCTCGRWSRLPSRGLACSRAISGDLGRSRAISSR